MLDKEATTYLTNEVPKIVDHWNSQNLLDRASTNLVAVLKPRQKLDQLFEMFQQLGSLKQLDTPKGSVVTTSFTGQGTHTVGNYTIQADFEKGPASISVQLLRVGNDWKINGFYIHSDVFLPAKAPGVQYTNSSGFNLMVQPK